jgi:hypothetical protein
MGTPFTTPVTELDDEQTQPRLTIDPTIRAGDGSEYAFNGVGYTQIVAPWAVENHIPPINKTERFGDVESWVNYIQFYGQDHDHLTWSERGLCAVLDYYGSDGEVNRCQWIAEHPFELTSQWKAWSALTNGNARGQRQLLEALEDLSEDIVAPDGATIVGILRTLRATVNATAATDLKEDGFTRVEFTKNTTIQAGQVSLPPEIKIAVPVLKGHTEEKDGRLVPVLYSLPVRIRVSVDDQAHLAFRLSMPTSERVLEAVYADRVAAAKRLLGTSYTLLRAAS